MKLEETAGRLPARRRRSTAAVVLEFLGSMNLAITLLVAVAVAAVIGTVLQQDQAYSDYQLKFGPFWFQVFKALGLYDVYSAGWFLFILAFLVTSTSVCVWRNGPAMLREIRRFRLDVQSKSLERMRLHAKIETSSELAGVSARAERLLRNNGWRLRRAEHAGVITLAGMKGGANRLGYLLTHVGIVVILAGGLMDSKLPLQYKLVSGQLKVETRDLPASKVPADSRLGLGTFSFRGNISIPEGSTANFVYLPMGDGFVIQKLPFDLTVKKFTVKHYITGQPSDFLSQVVLHDPRNGKTIEKTIRVNHPLVYDGYEIYQASFGDGGTKLDFTAWSLDGGKQTKGKGAVFGRYALGTGSDARSLELEDFRLFNIDQLPGARGQTTPRNLGPSVTFKLRDAQGVAREYVNYFAPQLIDGQMYYLSGVRASPAEPFRYLHIPAGPHGGVERFMAMAAALHDPGVLKRVAGRMAEAALQAARVKNEKMRARVTDSTVHLLNLFARGGYDMVLADIEKRVPKDRRQSAADVFLKVLNSGLEGVYAHVLAQQGITQPTQKDWNWFQRAVPTLSVLSEYGAPYYLQFTGFKHIQAAGLQITHHPGTVVVYTGAAMLVLGVFLLFFLSHRRIWVRMESRGEGGTNVLFAGTTNRNPADFEREFNRLKEIMFAPLKPDRIPER